MRILLVIGLALGLSFQTFADQSKADSVSSSEYVDDLVKDIFKHYQTPGLAITIVKDGKTLHLSGYGKKDVANNTDVNENTAFRIASASKAFTAAGLAILVDEGKIDWDDRVTDHLPGFQMSDPWVTREFTIRDLLTHRSGLGFGAGDLMLWPTPAGFSRSEIIHNLRHLKPVSSFRSEYAYDNLLYIVAGELIAAVSGQSWEDFTQTRLLNPLGNNCYSVAPKDLSNVATPHDFIGNELKAIPRNAINGKTTVYAAAGGISCNIKGLADWMQTWLNAGVMPSGKRLFSEKQRDEMWKSVTIMKPSRDEKEYMQAHFKNYALGWRKIDAWGYEYISHTGSLSGVRAWVSLIPELNLGIAIVDNGSNSNVRKTLMTALLSKFSGQPETNWVELFYDKQQHQKKRQAKRLEKVTSKKAAPMSQPLTAYAGSYTDPWFGKVDITLTNGELWFTSKKSIHLKGKMTPSGGNTFIVRWNNRALNADAWVKFDESFEGDIEGIRMKAISETTDFSFDFPDLNFTKDK